MRHFVFCLFPLACSRSSFTEQRRSFQALGLPWARLSAREEIQALLVAALPLPPPACSEFEKHLVRISSRLSTVPFSPPALGRHHRARQGGLVAGPGPVSRWGNGGREGFQEQLWATLGIEGSTFLSTEIPQAPAAGQSRGSLTQP